MISTLRPTRVMYYTAAMEVQKKYYHKVKDFSMHPLLHPDYVIEFVPSRPEPDDRVMPCNGRKAAQGAPGIQR